MRTKQVNPQKTPEKFFLPRMTPHPAWAASTAYVIGDLRTEGDCEYRCLENHTSSTLFGDDLTKWDKIGHKPYTYEDLPDNPGTFIGVPVYDLPHTEETFATGKGLRKRCKPKTGDDPDVPMEATANARLENITGKQHFFVDGYYNGQLVYTYELKAEYWTGSAWAFQELDGTIDIDNDLGVMTCTGTQGGFSWDISIGFSFNTPKWSWDITAPGFTVRANWIIEFTALGQQMMADGDLRFGYEDFTGNVSDDEGVAIRTIIFEPDGVDASSGWVVDPYLTIDDQSTYIDVTCDGYNIIIPNNTASHIALIRDPDDNTLYNIYSAVYVGTTLYELEENYSSNEYVIKTATAGYVKVDIIGDFKENGGNTLSTDESITHTVTVSFHIYSNQLFIEVSGDSSGTFTLANSTSNAMFQVLTDSSLTSDDSFYENAGSESDASGYTRYDSANYLLVTNDESNIQAGIYNADSGTSGTASTFQRFDTADREFRLGPINGDLGDGYNYTFAVVVDSADRASTTPVTAWATSTSYTVGDLVVESTIGYECIANHTSGTFATDYTTNGYWIPCHKYTSTNRLAMGDEWANTDAWDDVTTGDEVIDLNIPDSIGSDGIASDGARHIQPSSDVVKFTSLSQVVWNPAVVHHNDGFRTWNGTSADEQLVGWWKMDDTTGTTINATFGTNATLGGGDNLGNIGGKTDAIRGTSILPDGTTDYITLPLDEWSSTWKSAYTIIFSAKPNDTRSNLSGKSIYKFRNWNSNVATIDLSYDWNVGNKWKLKLTCTSGTIVDTGIGSAYSSDAELQKWHAFHVGFDFNKDFCFVALNGKVIYTLYDADISQILTDFEATTPNHHRLSDVFAAYFDSVKLYNGCILPYGGGPFLDHVNDYANPHESCLFFWDGSDVTTPATTQIGGVTGTLGSANTDGTTSFPTTGGIDGGTYFDNEGTANAHYFRFTITAGDICDMAKGSIRFWAAVQTIEPLYDSVLRAVTNSENDKIVLQSNINESRVLLYYGGTLRGTVNGDLLVSGEWHYFEIKWGDNNNGNFVQYYIDGVLQGEDTVDGQTAGTSTGTLTIGNGESGVSSCDGYFTKVSITDNPYTPDMWSMMGNPKIIKQLEVQ